MMKTFDDLASVLFEVIMSHAKSEQATVKMEKCLEKLEMHLRSSPQTNYFLNMSHYTMVDLYGFPHLSRIFYLKDSVLHEIYEKVLKIEEKYPFLYRWVHHSMRGRPELNDGKAIIKVQAFHRWLEELITLPIGKKPPLRIPMKL